MRNRLSIIKILLMFSSLSLSSVSFGQTYEWYNFVWHNKTAVIKPYTGGLTEAATFWSGFDYHANTNFTMSLGSSGEDIRVVESNFGALPFGQEIWGYAAPKNESGEWCVDEMTGGLNGKCTTSAPKRAAEGRVFVNTYYVTSSMSHDDRQMLISHEIGHLIGLDHSGECVASVMRSNIGCNTVYALEAGLITEINSKYP